MAGWQSSHPHVLLAAAWQEGGRAGLSGLVLLTTSLHRGHTHAATSLREKESERERAREGERNIDRERDKEIQ
jgi:hypothetical protein